MSPLLAACALRQRSLLVPKLQLGNALVPEAPASREGAGQSHVTEPCTVVEAELRRHWRDQAGAWSRGQRGGPQRSGELPTADHRLRRRHTHFRKGGGRDVRARRNWALRALRDGDRNVAAPCRLRASAAFTPRSQAPAWERAWEQSCTSQGGAVQSWRDQRFQCWPSLRAKQRGFSRRIAWPSGSLACRSLRLRWRR